MNQGLAIYSQYDWFYLFVCISVRADWKTASWDSWYLTLSSFTGIFFFNLFEKNKFLSRNLWRNLYNIINYSPNFWATLWIVLGFVICLNLERTDINFYIPICCFVLKNFLSYQCKYFYSLELYIKYFTSILII